KSPNSLALLGLLYFWEVAYFGQKELLQDHQFSYLLLPDKRVILRAQCAPLHQPPFKTASYVLILAVL
ncbi:MAG: hypothetical protein RI842_10295, partial [Schleiferiaceae bacterium]|nr:hypothetical protein [Schleiferiaceae bacterium]